MQPRARALDAAPAPDPLDDWRRAVWWHLAAHPPKAARGAGLAVIAFTLSADGELAELSVARSSGRAAFDRACLAAVRAAAPFPAPPREVASRDMSFEISIRAAGMGSLRADALRYLAAGETSLDEVLRVTHD